ncbi:MAG: fibronectin type III domain-containing protein [Candidatus Micrarchaeota archaeon]
MPYRRGQTALEYALFAGGAIAFVAVVVTVTNSNVLGLATSSVIQENREISSVLESFKQGSGPEITNIKHLEKATFAAVSWDTDVPASSYLEYWPEEWGPNPGPNQVNFNGNPAAKTHHKIDMPYSAPVQSIYYQITSCVPQGECTKSDIQWFNELLPLDRTPPSAILDLQATFQTGTSILLQWTAPGNDGSSGTARIYDVRYSINTINDANWASATKALGEPNPLIAGTPQSMIISVGSGVSELHFAIKSYDDVPLESPLSNIAIAINPFLTDATPPGPVTNLYNSSSAPGSITLNWTAPGDDGYTGTASQYDIRYSIYPITDANWSDTTQAAGEPSPQVTGTTQSFTISGLATGNAYYFAMKTRDEANNWSPLSNLLYCNVSSEDSTPPAAVYNLNPIGIYSFGIKLQWASTGDDGFAGTAAQYDLRYSKSPINESSWDSSTQAEGEPAPEISGTLQNFVVSGLNDLTPYYFAVKVADEVPNWSALSNVVAASTTFNDTIPPAAITNLTSINATSDSIILMWTAPGDSNMTGTATTYDIRYSTAFINSANWAAAIQAAGEPEPLVAGTLQNFTITGLSPLTIYFFAIKTADEVPNWSVISNVIARQTLNLTDITPPAAVADLVAFSPTLDSIALKWTATNDDQYVGTATSYDIRYSTALIDDDAAWDAAIQASGEPAPEANGTVQNFTVTGLNESTTYHFRIKAGDEVPNWSALLSNASNTTSSSADVTPPANITNLTAISSTANSIGLSWTSPGDDGNSGTAFIYDIRYSASVITPASWNSAMQAVGEPAPEVAGSLQTFTITGLAPGSAYYIAMKTGDEVPNFSNISNVIMNSTIDTAPPSTISNLTAPFAAENAITLRWTSPGDDGSIGTATTYDIRYSTALITSANFYSATQFGGAPVPAIAGTTQITAITALAAGTKYYFAIKTADEVPNWSNISNVVSKITLLTAP